MSFTDFLDLWFNKDVPVFVFSEKLQVALYDAIEACKPLKEYGYTPRFTIMPEFAEYRAFTYLKDEYANAEVTHFTLVEEGMIVFLDIV